MLYLTTLGAACVKRDDGPVLSLDVLQPKRIALLAYLAAARPVGAHRRDVIVSMFWPELDEPRARAALRQALHGIRKSIGGDAIVSQGLESLELSTDLLLCDARELDAAVVAGNHRRVFELYQGDFLAGLHVSGAPIFEQWLDGERLRLRRAVSRSMWELAESAARSQSSDVLRYVRAAMELSGLDEGSLRRGMCCLAASGERASAILLYERFAEDLRRELEVEVDPQTRHLADKIRSANSSSVRHEGDETERGTAATPAVYETLIPRHAAKRLLPARQRHVAIGVAAAVIALIGAAHHSVAADAQRDPRRVDVAEFANETSTSALDAFTRRATLDARVALTQLEGVVVPATAGTGGTLVRGILRAEGDSVAIRAEVIDVRTGAIVRSVVGRTTSRERVAETLASFTDRLSSAVATAVYPGWGQALSEPPSYSAYRSFLTGMREIKREHHEDAIAAFRRGFAEDSSFTAAGLLAAMELYQVRRFEAAESLATAIERRRDTLRPLDERLLAWLVRSLHGDRLGARAAMQTVVSLAPAADLAWLQLAIDNVETGRPREALAALDHIDRSADFGEGWAAFWATRIEALHLGGEHARELTVARDGLSRHPELRVLAVYELRALAALGRTDELDVRLRTLSIPLDSAGVTAESTVRQVALELAAHGNAAAAQRLLRRLEASYMKLELGRRPRVDQLSAARTYYLAGDYDQSAAIYDSIYRARPRCLDCAGVLGVIAARRGDRAAAERLAGLMSASDVTERAYTFGRPQLWRARIAAALGDRGTAAALLAEAFSSGLEFDVMTHTDPDLMSLHPDSLYRAFAFAR